MEESEEEEESEQNAEDLEEEEISEQNTEDSDDEDELVQNTEDSEEKENSDTSESEIEKDFLGISVQNRFSFLPDEMEESEEEEESEQNTEDSEEEEISEQNTEDSDDEDELIYSHGRLGEKQLSLGSERNNYMLYYYRIHLVTCESDLAPNHTEVVTDHHAEPITRKPFEQTYPENAKADSNVSYRNEYMQKVLLARPSPHKTSRNRREGDNMEKEGKGLMESKQVRRCEKQKVFSSNRTKSLTKALFIDLLEVVAGYLHKKDLVLVAGRSTQGGYH
ncbi:U3 small nucleolar ribonucleoprotein protein MPP10-like [Palaemon carinicauda]|uniref:U3 small nucleolar ribonucleoprotein protein MPP10-like n=1 Tax=Palaemon carinicauda TaxID=392227 RepID=UPI0035B62ADF